MEVHQIFYYVRFVKSKDAETRRFIERMSNEYHKNGSFKNWDDVEKRVSGFKKEKVLKHYNCFDFEDDRASWNCLPGTDIVMC